MILSVSAIQVKGLGLLMAVGRVSSRAAGVVGARSGCRLPTGCQAGADLSGIALKGCIRFFIESAGLPQAMLLLKLAKRPLGFRAHFAIDRSVIEAGIL